MTRPSRITLAIILLGATGCGARLAPLHDRAVLARYPRPFCTVDGLCWENPLPQGDTLRAVGGAGPNDLFVAAGNTLFRTDGQRWAATPVPGWESVIAIWAASRTSVFAVGGRGLILHFDGARWTRMDPGAENLSVLWSVVGRSPSEVYAAGTVEATGADGRSRYGGMILHYDGARWQRAYQGAETVYGLWLGPRGELFGVGDNGLIVARIGGAWRRMPSPTRDRLYTVWGTGGTNLYAGGDRGLLHYDGRAWSPLVQPEANQIQKVWGTGPDQVFAVETSGLVYRYDGARWQAEKAGDGLSDLWGRSPREVYAVGESGTLSRYDGRRWTRLTDGRTETLRAVFTGARRSYAAGDDGAVLLHDGRGWWSVEGLGQSKWRNLVGTSWVGIFGAEDQVFLLGTDRVVRHDGRSFTTTKLPGLALPRAIGGSGPRDLFVVGTGGTILHSDGGPWTRMDSRVKVDLLSVSGVGARQVWAAGQEGTLLEYDGSRWHRIGILTREDLRAVQAVGPDEVWVVAFGGLLFHYRRGAWDRFKLPCDLHAIAAASREDLFFVGGSGCVVHYDGRRFQRTRATLAGVNLFAVSATARELRVVGTGGTLLRLERRGPLGWPPLEERAFPQP